MSGATQSTGDTTEDARRVSKHRAGKRKLSDPEPGRRNLTDALTAALSTDPGLPRLESGRLRSTWLCEGARRIGLSVFMAAAGIRCSQRLGDLVAQLPAATEAELVALLGAAR